MSKVPQLTTEAGAPVADNQRSQTAGPGGPLLIQDHALIEKLARFNRERIPERVVHAVGSGAHGYFEVTSEEARRFTKMRVFEKRGKRTPVFLRFSTVAGSRGAADTARDPRGFAVKFYTEDGNWDLVGNNTPVFFIRDGIKFPDFIHSQKPDPFTNRQEPDNVWDFFSHTPEATQRRPCRAARGTTAATARCDSTPTEDARRTTSRTAPRVRSRAGTPTTTASRSPASPGRSSARGTRRTTTSCRRAPCIG